MKPNPRLKVKLGISNEKYNELEKLYELATYLISRIDDIDTLEDEIPCLVNLLVKTETDIQTAWGFEDNPDRRYFTSLPEKCSCPKMDNLDTRNTKYRHMNELCPIHRLK